MNERFRKEADLLLSDLKWEERDARRVLSAIERKKPAMTTKIRWGIVLAVLLALMGAVALAVGLRYTANFSAVQAARQALKTEYGLTTDMVRIFGEHDAETNGTHTVTYHVEEMGGFTSSQHMGEYTVVVSPNGQAKASWSLDSVDKALWQNGDLTASAWGAPQLAMLLERYDYYMTWQREKANPDGSPTGETREQQQANYDELKAALHPLDVPLNIKNPADMDEAMPAGEPQTELEAVGQGFMPTQAPPLPVEADKAARAALQTGFGLTDDLLDAFYTDRTLSRQADECRVTYAPSEIGNGDIIDWRWYYQELRQKLGSYTVTLSPDFQTVIKAEWSLTGVEDDNRFTETTWGKAEAYSARMLPWVLKLLDQNRPIAAKYPEDQLDWFTVEDAAAYDEAFRAVGFEPRAYQFVHVLPKEGAITRAEAIALAKLAIQTEYDMTDEALDQYFITAEYVMTDGGLWRIMLYGTEAMGSVTLTAEGEIQYVGLDSGLSGNG